MKATVKKNHLPTARTRARGRGDPRSEGKSVSAVIEDALRKKRGERLKAEFKVSQNYWSRIAREKGIFTEADLRGYLAK